MTQEAQALCELADHTGSCLWQQVWSDSLHGKSCSCDNTLHVHVAMRAENNYCPFAARVVHAYPASGIMPCAQVLCNKEACKALGQPGGRAFLRAARCLVSCASTCSREGRARRTACARMRASTRRTLFAAAPGSNTVAACAAACAATRHGFLYDTLPVSVCT
jgi:hypothetical protein